MEKESISEDYVVRWVALFEKARKLLKPKQFKMWLHGIGTGGSYEERCRAGVR